MNPPFVTRSSHCVKSFAVVEELGSNAKLAYAKIVIDRLWSEYSSTRASIKSSNARIKDSPGLYRKTLNAHSVLLTKCG